jgi:DNA polymerase III epsilon subunit-like protein
MTTETSTNHPPPVAFVDTETTGLDPFQHDAWEIAVILRKPGEADQEAVFYLEPDLTHADPKALEINRYHERVKMEDWSWGKPQDVARDLYRLLDGAVLVGSNPAFDADMISNIFTRYYWHPKPWHYRTVDIATLAAGYRFGQRDSGAYGGDFAFPGDLPSLPFSSRGLSRAVGVEPPGEGVAHTALGDAIWARDVYDAVTGGQQ